MLCVTGYHIILLFSAVWSSPVKNIKNHWLDPRFGLWYADSLLIFTETWFLWCFIYNHFRIKIVNKSHSKLYVFFSKHWYSNNETIPVVAVFVLFYYIHYHDMSYFIFKKYMFNFISIKLAFKSKNDETGWKFYSSCAVFSYTYILCIQRWVLARSRRFLRTGW